MQSGTLGTTKLRVTRLGIGLAALGRPGYVNLGRIRDLGSDRSMHALEQRTHEVLDAAHAAGIAYVDVARSYGRAEEFLASWLASRDIAAHTMTIGTKWGYTYTADWRVDAPVHEVKDHGVETLRRQWAETRSIVGDGVSLLQVHSATLESGIVEDAAVHDALGEMRAVGEVAALGISTSGADQAETIRRSLEIERDGRRLFDAVQATWNALEPSVSPALAEAHDAGVGVIVKEALANGRLVRGSESAPVAAIGSRLGVGPDAVALAWALQQPWADVVLSGAVNVDQLRSNVDAVGLSLDDADADVLRSMAEPVDAYWRARRELAWS